MQDVKLTIPDGVQKTPEELGPIFDQEVEEFSKMMDGLPEARGGGTLSKIEKMLIKTYLVMKVTGKIA